MLDNNPLIWSKEAMSPLISFLMLARHLSKKLRRRLQSYDRQITSVGQVSMVRPLIPPFYNEETDKAAMILTADPVQSHRYGVDLVRRHGKVVIVAQPPKFDFNWNDFIFRDLTFIGHLHGNGSDLQEVVDIVADKGISVSVTEFGIEDHEKMVDSLGDESRKGKSVLVF
jgi:D-arabinose 1-dehydrogenase-like Zn-dependent alcohol dehydrogenase